MSGIAGDFHDSAGTLQGERLATFAYEAQAGSGKGISGTIDAIDIQDARQRLEALGLHLLEIEPAQKPMKLRALRGEDFMAFNQQLAQLTSAGMPVEQGLRLIAQDMRSGRTARTIQQIAEELERGQSLAQAFEKHRGKFPRLYGKLIDAGVKSSNLPAMLLNLGRHMEMVQRLRASLWRAAAYPLMVLVGLAMVVIFMGLFVLPQFKLIFNDFKTELPDVTRLLLWVSDSMPVLLIIAAAVVVGVPLIWRMLQLSGADRAVIDKFVLPLPLIGPVLRQNLVARWCDALRLGVHAGLDLPAAVELAGDAVGSPALPSRDGQSLIVSLQAGRPLSAAGNAAPAGTDAAGVVAYRGPGISSGIARPHEILPASVVAAMELGSAQHDLPSMLHTLSQMYQQQADTRLNTVPAILTPLLLLLAAFIIGFVILGLFAPLIALIQGVSGGPGKW